MWPFGKKKVEVTVMSRENAVQYCREKHRQPSVIISISDPNRTYETGPFCSKENGVAAILPLSFCDADGPGKDVYGRDVDESDLMQDEDAAKIARFVRENRDKLIIVHCDAGILPLGRRGGGDRQILHRRREALLRRRRLRAEHVVLFQNHDGAAGGLKFITRENRRALRPAGVFFRMRFTATPFSLRALPGICRSAPRSQRGFQAWRQRAFPSAPPRR